MQTVFDARPPAQWVVDSYDDFVDTGMRERLRDLEPAVAPGHSVTLRNLKVYPPAHIELDDGDMRPVGPQYCHARQLTYALQLRVDVCDNGVCVGENEFLASVPCMAGSKLAPPDPYRDDHGGYYTIDGRRVVGMGESVMAPNVAIFLPGKQVRRARRAPLTRAPGRQRAQLPRLRRERLGAARGAPAPAASA